MAGPDIDVTAPSLHGPNTVQQIQALAGPADVRRVETVFKRVVGFDPESLIESLRGQVGLW
jgi:hypothetical protein